MSKNGCRYLLRSELQTVRALFRSGAQSRRMLWLIKADFAATRQPNPGNGTPALFVNLGANYTLFRERRHLCFEVVAHEIEFMRTIFIGRVKRGLSRRKREDPPAVPGINGFEAENVFEERAVRFRIFCVDDYVSTRNHALPQALPS
jgi:hypothetical protein